MTFLSSARRLLGVTAAVTLCTCGTLDRFDVDTSAKATIAKAGVGDVLLQTLLPFAGFDQIDFSQHIANQGVTEDQIDSVKMKTLVLRVEEPGRTLGFIERVDFYVRAAGQDRILVATGSDFEGETEVELDLPDAELKPYVTADSMTFDAEVQGSRPDQDTTVTADITLTIDATVPGCE